MALTAVFYNFSKRQNSTKVPANLAGTSFNVVLKNPTSMNAPVFTLNADTFSFNYCSFNGAYYFVTDVVSVRNDIWEIHCTKDVLATYRTQILASPAYVLYDSVGNPEIVDSRLAIKTSRTLAENSVAFPNVLAAGTYVLTCVGQESCASWWNVDPKAIELSTIYSNAYNAVEEPFVPQSWSQVPEAIAHGLAYLGEVVTKGISYLLSNGNAIDAIRNCIWLPFRPIVSGSSHPLYLGNYDTGISGYRIDSPVVQLDQVTVNIPWQYTDWRRNAPYTQVYLYLPFIGIVALPSAQLTGAESLVIRAALNVISGDLSINVNNGTQVLGSYGANVAMNVPIGSSNAVQRQVVNSIVAAGGAIVSAASGLGIAAGAAALSGIAGAAASQIAGVPTCVGGLSTGSASGLSTNIICFTSCHDTNVAPGSVADVIGLPAFRRELLSSVSGYVQTHEFSLQADAPDQDLQRVNTYLNGGAFLE